MTIVLSRGQVWNAYVPFNDGPFIANQPTGKQRPVVILGWSAQGHDEDGNVLVVPISSFDSMPSGKVRVGDIQVRDLDLAGLDKQSYIRARRLMTVNPRSLDTSGGMRGRVSDDELTSIYTELTRMVSPTPDLGVIP